MSGRLLVAGVGNIFRSDDGFGSAVVEWLQAHPAATWPEWVLLRDFGIRGVHLAYELLDGYDDVVLVDAVHRDGAPGSVYVIEPDLAAAQGAAGDGGLMLDAHDMAPEAVLALVPALGGTLGRVTVVGCEPVSLRDGVGLSELVARRVPEAGRLVQELVAAVVDGRAAGAAAGGERRR